MSFQVSKPIRFAYCDPAGIVFYPRYVELCNEVVEDWFEQGLGIGFRALHEDHRLGIPAARLEIDFQAPSRLGDSLDFELSVVALGRSSITLEIIARCDGRPRLQIRLKIVVVSSDTLRPIAIDQAWRDRFSAYLQQQPSERIS